MIIYIWFMPAPDDGGIPVKTVFDIFCIPTKVLNRRRHNICAGFCFCIQYFNSALVTTA